MLKKTIPYHDLDGNKLEETFEFHMSQADLAKMALKKEGKDGGFDQWVRNLIASNDGEEIVENFEKILLATIGKRSPDNKSFIKTPEITQAFQGSEAYSILFMELVTDMEKMSEFVNGVVPENMREELAKQIANAPEGSALKNPVIGATVTQPEPAKDDTPDWVKDPNRIPTEAELRGATPEQMMEAFRRKSAGAPPVTQEEITGQS